jgi:hypothetical protein
MSFFREEAGQPPVAHLFAFLEEPVSALSCGYFLKLVNFLLQTQLSAFLDYVYSRPELFRLLLQHPEEHKLCEAVQYLLNIDRSKE